MREIRPWQVLRSEYLVRRHWMNVRQDQVKTGRGVTLDEFHVVEYPSWACICCISAQGELVLIRQYRHGIGEVTLELPAGVIEPAEAPLVAAQRELREESGYTAEEWAPLICLSPEPARHTNLAHCFLARHATRTHEPALDASEDLSVETVPVSEVPRLIDDGAIRHAVHVAALMVALQRGHLAG